MSSRRGRQASTRVPIFESVHNCVIQRIKKDNQVLKSKKYKDRQWKKKVASRGAIYRFSMII
jgi:hypothetical protein